jgi:hypothetical protein
VVPNRYPVWDERNEHEPSTKANQEPDERTKTHIVHAAEPFIRGIATHGVTDPCADLGAGGPHAEYENRSRNDESKSLHWTQSASMPSRNAQEDALF